MVVSGVLRKLWVTLRSECSGRAFQDCPQKECLHSARASARSINDHFLSRAQARSINDHFLSRAQARSIDGH